MILKHKEISKLELYLLKYKPEVNSLKKTFALLKSVCLTLILVRQKFFKNSSQNIIVSSSGSLTDFSEAKVF